MSFFDYSLPPELIAQTPAAQRDQSRLLVVRRDQQSLSHHQFADLPKLLDPGDLLVLNDTRVLPARLVGRRERTGGKWEGLYLQTTPDGLWEMLCQTRGTLTDGEYVVVENLESQRLRLQFSGRTCEGHFLFKSESQKDAAETLARFGHVPLPPYIRKGHDTSADVERYQTVYARQPGAVAAPTAGLHFTEQVFTELRARNIMTTALTLHVGLGTFLPLQSEDYTKHVMHREWCQLPSTAAEAVNDCRSRSGRVVAVGTTAVRTLETAAGFLQSPEEPLTEWSGETDLFIVPPYQFTMVDALITNFHLPRTSLLLLVAAFAGEELIARAYGEAIEQRYRFFSYGDAMLIL